MTIIWFLLALAILVTFHEFGHFYVARLCGVKVLRFSVGFGKPLFTWTDKQGTDFTLAPIPLGGYVKMLDEREAPVATSEQHVEFTRKSVWQRMAIVLAGPAANFILAIVFYTALALMGISGVAPVVGEVKDNSLAWQAQFSANDEIVSVNGKATPTWPMVFDQLARRIGDTGTLEFGVQPFGGATGHQGLNLTTTKTIRVERWLGDEDRPDILGNLGLAPQRPQTDWTLSTVTDNGAAAAAGLQTGDTLLAYDGKTVSDWASWVAYVQVRAGQTIAVDFEREGQVLQARLTPAGVERDGKTVGQVGLAAKSLWPDGMIRIIDYSPGEAIAYGFGKTWEQIKTILGFIKKLLTLDVSVKNLGGAFTIAEVAGGTAAAGLAYYIGFLAFFSVSLGVFNLLPIPVLDGGHFLFYVIEAVKGSPLAEKWQTLGYQLGLFLIVSMMIVAHYNDLVRLFS